ncbi:MAG: group II truncated hemoglobin [Nakamurella sp.]
MYPSLFEYAGGMTAFERLTARFYDDILTEPDPVLEPVFRHMDAAHAQHVAAWLAETFGGPATYTRDHGGYHHMVNKHRNLDLTERQRRRWIDRMVTTADLVGLPGDPDFRAAFVSYLEWGTRIAVFNSRPGVELIQHAPVPRWTWGAAPPFVPFPWDDPQAADRGRQRHAAEHAPPD